MKSYTQIEKTEVIENGVIVGHNVYIKHYDKDDKLKRVDKNFEPVNLQGLAQQKRNARQVIIDTMILNAENADKIMESTTGTSPELATKITTLFRVYQDQVAEYVQLGTSTFGDAVTNESDPDTNAILDFEVPRADGTGMITIKDSILTAIAYV